METVALSQSLLKRLKLQQRLCYKEQTYCLVSMFEVILVKTARKKKNLALYAAVLLLEFQTLDFFFFLQTSVSAQIHLCT